MNSDPATGRDVRSAVVDGVDPCPECGAPPSDGRSCARQWDELVALEFSDVRAGAVHALTVACYQVQHPLAHRLTPAARAALVDVLRDVVERGVPVSEARDALQRRFDGARRVRSDDAVAAATPRRTTWSSTVADAFPPDPETHADRVRAWARDVLDDLA